MSRFFGVAPAAYQVWRSDPGPAAGPLTRERLERMWEDYQARVASGFYDQPVPELHHPTCPKIVTGGKKACRCGTVPLEAILEDDMERKT